MNEVHISGTVKSSWRYDGNLYVRVSTPRDPGRPSRSPEAGGDYDYVTVVFSGGAEQGLQFQRGQQVAVHGWLQSRDVHESLDDFLRRAARSRSNGDAIQTPALAQQISTVQVHRSVNEIVAERWRLADSR